MTDRSPTTGLSPRRSLLPDGFVGMLFATAMWLPVALGAFTLIFYLSKDATVPFTTASLHANAVPAALIVVLGGWLLLAAIGGPGALPESANSQSYSDIQARIAQLRTLLSAAPPWYQEHARHAMLEATTALDEAAFMLRSRSPSDTRWVAATGYVDALRLVHQAEQSAIMFAPVDFVVRIATDDAARLDGSKIAEKKSLNAQLIAALRRVSPETAAALEGVSLTEERERASATPAAPTTTETDGRS